MKPRRKRSQASTPGKMDIRGVAALARVSIATVSRTINHVPTVDPALAARVWKAVQELNYLPNTQARALVSGRSRLIGLIVSEITNPFFPELIQEFEQAAVARGYEILIGSTNYETQTMEICARRMLERKVDGVAVMTFGFEDFFLDRFTAENIPYVFIDPAPSRPLNSVLAVNYLTGISEGVQHLAVLGHRKIAFISGPLNRRSALSRKEAFLSCLHSIGINPNPDWLIEGDHTLDGGRDAMQKILAQSNRPTAIMCSNDMTAIGVQHAVFEAGLRIPDDFSLIGFDDIHLTEYTIPPLTTIRMSCRELAARAMENLLNRTKPIAGTAQSAAGGAPAALNQSVLKPDQASATIPTHLIVRRTTGLPGKALQDLRPDDSVQKQTAPPPRNSRQPRPAKR
ncbi:MAG: LacI family DNA-binding transcriptional regulator [Acidobacteriota bacterium]